MEILKKLTRGTMMKKIISVIIIVIFFIFLILAPAYYWMTIDDGEWKEDEKGRPSHYTQNVKISTDEESGGLEVDKKKIIIQALKDLGYTDEDIKDLSDTDIIKILKLNKKIKGNNDFKSLDDVTAADVLWCMTDVYSKYLDSPEELEKLLNAEIITQYPKMGEDDSKLDGIVQFERHKTDGTSKFLKYISRSKFNKYIEDQDINIVDYFTLDENGQVLIGVVDTTIEELTSNDEDMKLSDYTDNLSDEDLKSKGNYTKTEYTVSSKAINYKNAISKYTMPFQYLWALIVVGEDKDVGLELADLVEDSQIIISIYDNITTTVNTKTYTYNKQKKVDVYAEATAYTNRGTTFSSSKEWKPANEWVEDKEYKIVHTTTYKNNTPVFDVTKADVWIVDYSKEYKYQAMQKTSEENNEKSLDSTEYEEEKESPKTSSNGTDLLYYDKFSDKLGELLSTVTETARNNTPPLEIRNLNSITQIPVEVSANITTVRANYYTHNVSRNEKDNTVISEQKYVETPAKCKYKIEKNTDQVNFVTILCENKHKAAKRKITQDNVTSWLFEILETNSDTINMVELTKRLLNIVVGREKFKTDFDFEDYEPGNLNTVETGISASYSSLNLTQSDLEILYKITSAERGGGTQEQQEYVVSVILNRVLSSRFPNTVHDVVFAPMQFQPTRNGAYEAAKPSATTIAAVNNVVQTGDKAHCAVYFMTPAASLTQKWLANCEFLFNDKDDSLRFTNTGGTHNFYTTEQDKNELGQYVSATSEGIVGAAVQVHKYVRENGYRYSQSGVSVPNLSSKTIDCSSFVTWVLVNANVSGFISGMGQWNSSTFNANPLGWQEVSVNEAQPGDILVYSGHVEIVAAPGNDKFIVYNCGSNSSIMAQGLGELPETTTSGRSKSSVKKILRVPSGNTTLVAQ